MYGNTRFNKDSLAQGAVVRNAAIDFIELDERRTNRLNPSFARDFLSLHPPVAAAPGQDPNYQHHMLVGEIAWMREGAEPSSQQEPVIFTSFTDAQVHSADLVEYDGIDIPKEEKLWRALNKKYHPVGFIHHDVRVSPNTHEVQDRPNIRCAGITNFEHFGSEPIGFWEPLVADIPRAEERRARANQSTAASKACGVLRPLNSKLLQPSPDYLARVYGVHSPAHVHSTKAHTKGRPNIPKDKDDFASSLLEYTQYCFYLGAQAHKDHSAYEPEMIAGMVDLNADAMTNLVEKDAGDWSGCHIPQMLMRKALGMHPEAILNIEKFRNMSPELRTAHMSTGPRFLASMNENLRRISRRVVGFSTRAVNPGFQGEMFIKMGL